MSDTAPRFVALNIHAQPIENGMEHLITRDTRTGLEWTGANAGRSAPHAETMAACEAVEIAGGGWRAPTREELLSIVDITRCDPAVDTAAFPFVKSRWYWSSDAAAWSSASAWVVGFGLGDVYDYPRSGLGFALAVRRAGQ
jgi:hypothetical protein